MKTIFIIILVLVIIAFGIYKFNTKNKKEKDPVTPPFEPLPIPVPTIEVIEIEVSEDGDQTDTIQDQINAIPKTSDVQRIIRFPEGKFKTEGNAERIGIRKDNAIIYFDELENFIVEGGSFYTTAPFTNYGGSVGNNDYSHRRHIKFNNCKDFITRKIEVTGSNLIDGRLIGMTEKNTPDFWYQSYDKGEHVPFWYLYKHEERLIGGREIPKFEIDEELSEAVKEIFEEKLYTEFLKEGIPEGEMVPGAADSGSIGGAPAYKAYWEFEHAFDFTNCKRFIIEDVKVNGVWGDGICIGHGNEDWEILNPHLRFVGRQGVAIYDSRIGLIDGVWVDLGRRAAIDMEPYHAAGYANNIEIRNCKLHAVQVPIAAVGLGEVNDINIHDNEYSGGSFIVANSDSRLATQRKNWRVTGNKRTNIFGSPSASIKFYKTDNVYVADNVDHLSQDQSRAVAQFSNCIGVVWENNKTELTSAKQNPTSPNHAVLYSGSSEIEIKNNEYLEVVEF